MIKIICTRNVEAMSNIKPKHSEYIWAYMEVSGTIMCTPITKRCLEAQLEYLRIYSIHERYLATLRPSAGSQ